MVPTTSWEAVFGRDLRELGGRVGLVCLGPNLRTTSMGSCYWVMLLPAVGWRGEMCGWFAVCSSKMYETSQRESAEKFCDQANTTDKKCGCVCVCGENLCGVFAVCCGKIHSFSPRAFFALIRIISLNWPSHKFLGL